MPTPTPPQPQDAHAGRRHRSHRHHSPYSGPFDGRSHRDSSGSRPHYEFTDPFELFNSIFGDLQHDPVFGGAFTPYAGRARADRPSGQHSSGFGSLFGGMFNTLSMLSQIPSMVPPEMNHFHDGQGNGTHASSRGAPTHSPNSNRHWVSQSRMTSIVNGVMQSVWKRTDSSVSFFVASSFACINQRGLSRAMNTSPIRILMVRNDIILTVLSSQFLREKKSATNLLFQLQLQSQLLLQFLLLLLLFFPLLPLHILDSLPHRTTQLVKAGRGRKLILKLVVLTLIFRVTGVAGGTTTMYLQRILVMDMHMIPLGSTGIITDRDHHTDDLFVYDGDLWSSHEE